MKSIQGNLGEVGEGVKDTWRWELMVLVMILDHKNYTVYLNSDYSDMACISIWKQITLWVWILVVKTLNGMPAEFDSLGS